MAVQLERIVSGGQSGVDRAALDVALALAIPCGGWCPRGRRAEDGRISHRYPLRETPAAQVSQRTEWNVRDSDGTLILCRGPMSGGTLLTRRLADAMNRPCLVVDLTTNPDPDQVLVWLALHGTRRLNVAGPRESGAPGIHAQAVAFLRQVLSGVMEMEETTRFGEGPRGCRGRDTGSQILAIAHTP